MEKKKSKLKGIAQIAIMYKGGIGEKHLKDEVLKWSSRFLTSHLNSQQ